VIVQLIPPSLNICIYVCLLARSFKELAERGDKDGMVGYANCLNNGVGAEGFDEVKAAHWWREACGSSAGGVSKGGTKHRHSQGCYEFAVALYTGK
jgi:hypothetical protein